MDVKKVLAVLTLALFLFGCDSNNPSSDNQIPDNRFIKIGDSGDCGDLRIPGEYLVRWQSGEVSVVQDTDDEHFVDGFLAEHRDEVYYSEPHYQLKIPQAQVPAENRSEFSQRGWGGEVNWGISAIAADVIWALGAPLESVVVAVIDSGMDRAHPELVKNLYVNASEYNGEEGDDNDGNGLIDDISGYDFALDTPDVVDSNGHGTHVAGVIGADHGLGQVLGVAPNSKILPISFIGPDGSGSIFAALSSIRYAASQGAKVINASWGGPGCSATLRDEIGRLAAQNILFVTAAGNSGNDLSQSPEYPAAFDIDNMITVGASTVDEKTAAFSNYGLLVDLVAPGANIVSTYPAEFDGDKSLDGLFALNGTSMATPYVAGAAALLWGMRPDASYSQIKEALLLGVESGPYPVSTRGQLNLPRAWQILNSLP